MGLGVNLNGALSGAATGSAIGSAIPGVGTAIGAIGGGIMGLFRGGGSNRKDQEKLMDRAWEYEKEGMGLQYQYGQQAADEEQRRNMEMWNNTNYEAQRKHLEAAGLNPGLMYGNGGAQGASTAGGKGMMPSAPTTNPVAMGLQLKGIELQNKAIESQNLLNTANAAKSVAEAKKIGGVDTEKAEREIQWQEIENRIQSSREAIEANNINKSKAEADEAIENWKIAVKNREYADETYEQRVQKLTEEIALIQKEGALKNSMIDLNYTQARKVQKEIDNFYYEVITRRMTAEAAKEQAANTLEKIKNDYELGKGHLSNEDQKNLREWIFGGINQITDIVETIGKLKNAKNVIVRLTKIFNNKQ